MDYKSLEEINKKLKTTDIKGKDYIEVNERIKAFWQLCENGKIITQLLNLENGICVFKAEVYEDKNDLEPRATGTAYEKEGSTFINKTSYIENCETSAVGRALGNAGIGINTSVASAEEVQNAILQQTQDIPKINKEQENILRDIIKQEELENEEVIQILEANGYKKLSEIKLSDYVKITNQIKGEK
jgi:hypothetical protein